MGAGAGGGGYDGDGYDIDDYDVNGDVDDHDTDGDIDNYDFGNALDDDEDEGIVDALLRERDDTSLQPLKWIIGGITIGLLILYFLSR